MWSQRSDPGCGHVFSGSPSAIENIWEIDRAWGLNLYIDLIGSERFYI